MTHADTGSMKFEWFFLISGNFVRGIIHTCCKEQYKMRASLCSRKVLQVLHVLDRKEFSIVKFRPRVWTSFESKSEPIGEPQNSCSSPKMPIKTISGSLRSLKDIFYSHHRESQIFATTLAANKKAWSLITLKQNQNKQTNFSNR